MIIVLYGAYCGKEVSGVLGKLWPGLISLPFTRPVRCHACNRGQHPAKKKLMKNYDEAVQAYQSVKESIKYTLLSHWGSPEQTLRERRGHCGMKSEVLVAMLRDRGFKARYVEGHQTGLKNTWMMRIFLSLGLVMFDGHIWVEVFIDNEWLTLDSAPDSGIAHCLGDTKPGTHLGNPKQIARFTEIPAWYKDGYNLKLFSPLRFAAGIELALRRLIIKWQKK